MSACLRMPSSTTRTDQHHPSHDPTQAPPGLTTTSLHHFSPPFLSTDLKHHHKPKPKHVTTHHGQKQPQLSPRQRQHQLPPRTSSSPTDRRARTAGCVAHSKETIELSSFWRKPSHGTSITLRCSNSGLDFSFGEPPSTYGVVLIFLYLSAHKKRAYRNGKDV